jgi:4-hydroxy-tetrahydrodipicolinate reductase
LAVGRGVACVVGSSGLTEADYAAIELLAREQGVGIIAAGNFSVMAAILQHCALLAAQHLASFEVIDYCSATLKIAAACQSVLPPEGLG